MKKIWYNWKKPVKVISIISICLALVLLAGCFVNAFVDIENGKLSSDIGDKLGSAVGISKTRNSQNILDPEFYENIEGDQNGVDVTVNDDGSITLDGKAKAASDLALYKVVGYEVCGVAYTIGAVDFGEDAAESYLHWSFDGLILSQHYRVYSGDSVTFTVLQGDRSDLSEHYLFLSIAEGDSFDNVTIYPTLNYGYVAQPFYEASEGFGDKVENLFGNKKDRNDANILDPEVYENIDGEINGVEVTVNDDGSITLDGKATSSIWLSLCTFEDSIALGRSFAVARADFGEDAPGAYFEFKSSDPTDYVGQMIVPAGYDFSYSCVLPAGISVFEFDLDFGISISAGDKFDNVTIYPVLNYGVTAVSYFE